MAHQSPSKSSVTTYEPLDKLSSSTLKRHPKMELSKTDLLKLLSYLEGEVQAREIAIATLKAEKVKQLLYQAKYGKYGNDPFAALQRDTFGAHEKHLDESAVKAMYDNQLAQLENMISQHRNAQGHLNKQLMDAEESRAKMLSELEDEKRKHAQDTAQGDDVTYLLEKERERLNKEIEIEKSQNRKIEKDLKKSNQLLEQERQNQKQIVLLLLAERKRMIVKLLEERQKSEQLAMILNNEKSKINEMVDGLEEESKKSLQMEAELERQQSEFDTERGQLKHRMEVEELKSRQLQEEVERLQRELDSTREQLILGSNPNIRVTQSGLAGGGLSAPRTTGRSVSPKPPGLNNPVSASKPSIPPKVGAALQQRQSLQTNSSLAVTPQPPGVPPKTGSKVFKVPSPTPSQRVVGNVQPVASEVASKVSVPAVVPQMATEPMANRFSNQDSFVPDAANPNALTPIARVPPIVERSIPVPGATSQVAASVHAPSPGPRVFNTQQHGKVTFQVTSTNQASPAPIPPVAPPKKQIPPSRGAPPPVPPNKPVLSPHQMLQKKESITKGMTPPRNDIETPVEVNESHAEIASPLSITLLKDKLSPSASAALSDRVCEVDGDVGKVDGDVGGADVDDASKVACTAAKNHASMDIIGQELADFQQLLVSMVSGKG